MSDVAVELSALFEAPELTTDVIEQVADRAHESAADWEQLEHITREYAQRVSEGGGEPLRLALAQWLLGRFGEALASFEQAPAGALRHIYAAQAASALGRHEQCLAELQQAVAQGWDAFDVDMRSVETLCRLGRLDEAQQLLEKHARMGEDRGDWYYANGRLAEARDDKEQALEMYDRAVTLEPQHQSACFRAAWIYDMRGEDEAAIGLYERLAERPRAYVNALLNLAVIFEDTGRYIDAIRCLRRVLRCYPNHRRARLFLKDVESSREMVIQDEGDSVADARDRLLDAPISQFELSVRARNCLKKMNIHTLGQLVQLSEAELLAYKNFGEASLSEIRQLLVRKGLRLGQRPDEIDPAALPAEPAPARPDVPPGREALLAKSVAELELSVRARRCLQRLNVQTLNELVQLTEAELMSARNFGVTSLNEIKSRLADFGLALAPRRPE